MKKTIVYILLSLSAIFLICGCSNKQNIRVKEKDGQTYLTIPDALNNTFSLSKPLISSGFEETDDALTFVISNDKYKTFIDTLKDKINTNIANANESSNYPSVSEIKIDDAMEKLEVSILPSAYEDSDDDVIIKALSTQIIIYKIYTGEKAQLEIKYYDAESKSVYDTEKISY